MRLFCYRIVGCSATVLAILVALAAHPLIGAFLKEDALINQGVVMLWFQLPGMILMGLGLVTICTFQSMGKGLPALILSLCRQGVIYAIVIAVLSATVGYYGVISAQLVADVVTIVISAGLFFISIRPELT